MMFKKLKNKIRQIRAGLISLARQKRYEQNDFVFRKILEGQRVLILGAGSSVNELKIADIPEDIKILTTKRTLKLFTNNKIDKKIDLYFGAKHLIERRAEIKELLSKVKIKNFVIDDSDYLKNLGYDFGDMKIILDDFNDNYYLRRLIKPYTAEQIRGKMNHMTSSGMRLLQYALYFKAKEIYLIGMDMDEAGYFWKEGNKQLHLDIDNKFMEIVSGKYNNMFSLSKKSGIIRYVPYKGLE